MSSRKRERFVLVECYPDETLVNVLGIPYDQIQHARGKGNIANALRNHYTASVGLVDEDPKSTQPRYFSKMEPVKEFNEQGLIVKRDQQNSNHLVMLRPRLEEWIIKEWRFPDPILALGKCTAHVHARISIRGNCHGLVEPEQS